MKTHPRFRRNGRTHGGSTRRACRNSPRNVIVRCPAAYSMSRRRMNHASRLRSVAGRKNG